MPAGRVPVERLAAAVHHKCDVRGHVPRHVAGGDVHRPVRREDSVRPVSVRTRHVLPGDADLCSYQPLHRSFQPPHHWHLRGNS